MQVNEIFYSIQGEGINIGQPSVFLRLSGCHLRCVWCDTKYTWDLKSGRQMSVEKVAEKIKEFPTKNLVITGGEPLIQQSEIRKLLELLPGYYVEIETSGSILSTIDDIINHYNCSPKLSNSENKVFKLFKFPAEKTYYKFVVSDTKNLEEIKQVIKDHNIDKSKVLLMPEGIKKREIQEKSLWLAEICKKENLRFTPRLHIYLWGNKRKT